MKGKILLRLILLSPMMTQKMNSNSWFRTSNERHIPFDQESPHQKNSATVQLQWAPTHDSPTPFRDRKRKKRTETLPLTGSIRKLAGDEWNAPEDCAPRNLFCITYIVCSYSNGYAKTVIRLKSAEFISLPVRTPGPNPKDPPSSVRVLRSSRRLGLASFPGVRAHVLPRCLA